MSKSQALSQRAAFPHVFGGAIFPWRGPLLMLLWPGRVFARNELWFTSRGSEVVRFRPDWLPANGQEPRQDGASFEVLQSPAPVPASVRRESSGPIRTARQSISQAARSLPTVPIMARCAQFLAGHQGRALYREMSHQVSGFLAGHQETVPTPPAAARLRVHPEALRLVAYGAFWAMVLFAICMHSLFVRGVDMDDTPLVRIFGYNNICVYWDYSPSRELTALFYPLVEFPLLAYVTLKWLQVRQSYRQRAAPKWLYRLSSALLPVKLVLLSWFRMVFVVIAFEDTKGHTLGFQGLQLSLVLVALQDVLFMEALQIAWPRFGRKLTRVLHWTYFVALTVVTFLKLLIVLTLFYASAPVVDPKTSSGAAFCQILDRLWMLLAAVLPIALAELERRSEPGLYFVVTAAGAQHDDPEGK